VWAPSGSRLTLAFDCQVGRKGVSRMSEDDVLFGYRLRVIDHAARTLVSEAWRVFGIHRSTYCVWKRRVERHGLEIVRPRERRRPRLPNQLSPFVEERIVAFALGHPGYGPRRIASELRRERWGGLLASHNGVWRCLRRHGLNTRAKRLSLVAGYAAPTSRRGSRSRSGTSRPSGRASWSGSTASSSAGCPGRKARSGS
jgi:transposase